MNPKILYVGIIGIGIYVLLVSLSYFFMGDGLKAMEWLQIIGLGISIVISLFLIIVFTKELFRKKD